MSEDQNYVDVHSHYFPNRYIDFLAKADVLPDPRQCAGLGAGAEKDEMATRLSYMDKAGVQLQVLSPSPMTPCAADAKVAAEAAKLINDMLADLTVRHPDRFRFVAALPLPHVEEALAEMDRSAKLDNFVGLAMTTSTSGKVLTDPAFLPIWEELDKRSACLVLHPAGVNACSPLLSDSLIWPVGSPIEDSVAVVQLITNGYPSRFPNVTIVNAHFGGILPMVVDRLNHQLPHAVANLPESPGDAVARMYYDTVGQGSAAAMEAAITALGAERLLLGTDFPYQKDEVYVSAIDYVRSAKIPDAVKKGVLGETARRLFNL